MRKCCGIVYNKQTKTCGKLRSPYLLDLVGDRVKSRLLTITIFLSVFTFAGYTLFWEVMNRPEKLETAPFKPTKVEVIKLPSTDATIGVPLSSQPSIQVYGQDGKRGVEGVLVNAKAYYYDPNQAKRFEAVYLEDLLSDEYIEEDVALTTMNQLKIYQPILSGTTYSYSNEEGVANFDNLTFAAAYPGINIIYFESNGTLSDIEILITVKGTVSSIEFSSNPPENITIGESFLNQPIYATIKDTTGELLSGKYLRIFALNDLEIFGDFMNQRFYLMGKEILGPSDDDGIITIDINVTATNTKKLFFQVACEGNLMNWVYSEDNFYQSTKILTNVDSVNIITQPYPTNISEDEAFETQPVVEVLDSNGFGIAGKRVIAMISTQLNSTLPYFISDLPEEETKHLINAISTETDSNGRATFQNLAFSMDGSTNQSKPFGITFVCDGVSSSETNLIYVKSKVDHIKILGDTFVFDFLFDPDEEWPPNSDNVTQPGLMHPSLQIRVLDSQDNPVSGKVPHFRTINTYDQNDSVVVIQTIDTVSDFDGICSTEILARSAANGTNEFRIEITIDDLAIDLGVNLSLTVFQSSTNIAPITVRVLDFARRPLPNNDIYILFSTPSNLLMTIFPYWLYVTTNSSGIAVLDNLIIEGYNITGSFVLSGVYDRHYICYSKDIKIDIRTPVTKMELLQAPLQSKATNFFTNGNFKIRALDQYSNPVANKTAIFYVYYYPTFVSYMTLSAFLTSGGSANLVENRITNERQFFGFQTSDKTDDNGTVEFDNFIFYQPGIYKYFFMVDGIFMEGFEGYHNLQISNVASSLTYVQIPYIGTPTLNREFDYFPILALIDESSNYMDLQRVKLKTYVEGLDEDEYTITFYCGDEHTDTSPDKDCYSYEYTYSGLMYFYDFMIVEFESPDPCFQLYFVFAEGESYEIYSGLTPKICMQNYITNVTALSDISSYLTIESYSESAAILQTETLLGSYISGLAPDVTLVDKPPGFIYCSWSWQYFSTDDQGQCYIWILLHEGCVTGKYSFVASIGGVNASTLFYVELSDKAAYIDIVEYENQTSVNATVGEYIPESYEVVVKIYTKSELNGKSVTAFVSGYHSDNSEMACASNATVPDDTFVQLDPYHSTQITKSNNFVLLFQYYGTESSMGTAVFNLLKFTAGISGFYCVKFKADDKITPTGIHVNLTNDVVGVNVLITPSKKTKTGEPFPQQPKVKAVSINGTGLANKTISVEFNGSCLGGSITYEDNTKTDSNGEYQFTDLIVSGNGGDCQLIFVCDGIHSINESNFAVIGLTQPSFSYIGKWKTIIALTVLALIPLFFFNEAKTANIFLVIGFLACGVPEFFGYVALEKLSFKQDQDGDNPYLQLVTSLFIICINVLALLFGINAILGIFMKRKWQFHDRKTIAYIKFVKHLFKKDEDAMFANQIGEVDIFDSEIETESEIELDNLGNKVKRTRDNFKPKDEKSVQKGMLASLGDMLLSTRSRLVTWLAPREKTQHHKFEPSCSFFYPQRLLLALSLSILLLIYFVAGAFLLIEWFVFYLKKWRDDIYSYQNKLDYIIQLINESILYTVTRSSSLNPAKIKSVPDSVSNLFRVSESQITRLINIMKFSGRFCAIVLFLVMLFIWWLIFRLYRRRIMWMRQGVRFGKHRPNTGRATSFAGLAAAHFTYGFVVLWLITASIVSTLLYFPFFDIIWFLFKWFFYIFMVGFFLLRIWEIMMAVFVRRNSVVQPKWFASAEFIWTILNFFYGVAFASARVFRVLYYTLFHYVRVDLDTLHNIRFLKRAFRSYVGMIYMDHIHNNPIRFTFGNMFTRILKDKNKKRLQLAKRSVGCCKKIPDEQIDQIEDQIEPKPEFILHQKVKSRFLVLLTLSRNPNLVKWRKNNLPNSNVNLK
ncbi:hypothetical protein M0811_01983 [Anaeramoeba ignava]|uniref:Uncharacterized protein n=1 Tax=Anaeramoeba ignava TaxID=1746090 RepID=A0A9Q0LD70_ANAIG|nr:hypothetical protein M0811_01983 [Anaeramoeba ignava]